MLKKEIRIEIIWILSLAVLTIILIGVLTGKDSNVIDNQLYDTYYVLNQTDSFFLIFLNTGFWVYFIRQLINKFKTPLSNIVLIFITGLLIFITTFTFIFANHGWTIYPPLSASQNPITTFEFKPLLIIYQFFQIAVLGFVGVRTGRGIERLKNQKN